VSLASYPAGKMSGMIGQRRTVLVRTVVIDCPDPRALAAAELLGLTVSHDEDDWVVR
jgi:hypothetical protein